MYVLNIDGMKITSTDEVTLLGVSIDNKLTFKNQTDELCRKASYKFYAVRHIRPFLSKEKARLLANSFINCQFLYAPLIWMFASKISINKTSKIYFKTLQIVHSVNDKSYEELLPISNYISVHQKHLRILAIEFYKSLMKTNPDFMCDFYTINLISYDLYAGEKLDFPIINTTCYGLNSLIILRKFVVE